MHLHAPGTKLNNGYGEVSEASLTRYIEILETSPVEAFGITDYFSSDSYFRVVEEYRSQIPWSGKALFLNIELRLSESISKDGGQPHIHVLFDNDRSVCNKEQISRFLTHLQTQSINAANVKSRCIDLRSEDDFASATVSIDNLLDALKQTFGEEQPYLIAFPAKNNGLRSTDTRSPRKASLADRIDRQSHVFFGGADSRDYFLRTNRYRQGSSIPKPVISGCDAHSFEDLERLSGDEVNYPPTWIKAETTFAGLKQICYEPESRVFIGSRPDVLVRQEQDGTKFLSHLEIDQFEGYNEKNGHWFKNVKIPFNPELTAIIGNKGSGKSAVVDILGLLGESRQQDHFSFLVNDTERKKFRQRGFAENFEANLTWASGGNSVKRLNEDIDGTKPEAVRYLPQSYFEQVTNEIEIEQFRREIEDVVFSHVEETERLGKSSFSELQRAKTIQSKQEIDSLTRQLSELNQNIVRLEEQLSPRFKQQLTAKIRAKRDELSALDKAKPEEIPKPEGESKERVTIQNEVGQLRDLANDIATSGNSGIARVKDLKNELNSAESIRESLLGLKSEIEERIGEIGTALAELGIDVSNVIRFEIQLSEVDKKIADVRNEIRILERNNGIKFSRESDYSLPVSVPDLRAAFEYIRGEIKNLQDQLSAPQRRYESYMDRLAEWESRRVEILGTESNPEPGSLTGLIRQMTYLNEELPESLKQHLQTRNDTVRLIHESKKRFLKFYEDLKASVERCLFEVRDLGFEIEIEASLVVDHQFQLDFFEQIDQRKRGPFRSDENLQGEFSTRLREVDWADCDSVLEFLNEIVSGMKRHNGEELLIADQVQIVEKFYDFLFSLDYLSPRYELRLGDKNLNELSPGEKGLLLLVFFLQLDQDSIPLIIDQPEDNLDNESVFKVLGACLRIAKTRRQVILVTHNPNLAVGADAEQVIYVNLDKSANYKFSYESGAIEDEQINSRIVEILEGTQPAFVKRRLKYGM